MALAAKLTISDDVVARQVGGETMLLDLASGTYFGLNAVGGRFWQLVESEVSPQEARDTILAEYEVAAEELDRDLAELVDQLASNGLVIAS